MKKPNVLLVITDQQRFDTIAAAGYPWMQTPALDRLVREGCLFRNAHSTNPICVPARYDLLTGRSARIHNHYDNAEIELDPAIPTLPGILTDNGWRTAAIGKCHFTPQTALHGYQEIQFMEELPEKEENDAYLQYLREQGFNDLQNIHGIRPLAYHLPQKALVPEEHLGPNWLAQQASDWIDANSSEPFLLTLGWIKPHPPWNTPDSKRGIYTDSDLPEPIPKSRALPFSSEDSNLYGDPDSPEEKRKIREAYYESITMVDDAFGRVLNALERNGQLDNTVIIYTADHGEMLQDKGFYQKALPYDSACRIPLVIRWPERFAPGSVRDDFVDLLDIFPTLLDIGGIEDGPPLDGESLLSGNTDKRRIQFVHCYRDLDYRWVMTRNERYKYIYWFAGGTEYFYDLHNDPEEKHNLIDTPDCPATILDELKNEAIRREQQVGPKGSLQNGTFVSSQRTVHPPFDWNNGDKYPRWCFNAFQPFDENPDAFLNEFSACRPEGSPFKCPPEATDLFLRSFRERWNTGSDKLNTLLPE